MWEVGLPPSPVEFSSTASFTSFPTPDCWACAAAPASRHVCLQLMWEVGPLPSPVEFSSLCHSHKLSCSWFLGMCPCSHPLWPGPTCLFTVPGGIPLPPFSTQGVPPSLLCVFIVLIAYYSVPFLPRWWSVCPGGYADLAQGYLWKYCILLSSPCPCLPKPSGCRHLAPQGPS
jgi:hypothetical protein